MQRAAKQKPVAVEEQGATLLPGSVTTAPPRGAGPRPKKAAEEIDVDAVFAKLKQLDGKRE
jgi:uncharacterized protein